MASLDEFQVKLLRPLTCIQNPVSRRYFARHHKLPKEWSDIMARKNWNTLSETTLQVGAAGLEFVRMYNATHLGQKGVRLAHGIFSQFCQQHVLLQEVHQHGPVGLCLGHATWPGLCWPVRSMDFGNPEVTCFHAETFEHMFVTVPNDAEPLLKSFFGNSALVKKLKQQDHNALVEHLCCPPAYGNPKALAKMPRVDLMHSLVGCIGGDDVEWIKAVKEMLQRPTVPEKHDPENTELGTALDELILWDMPAEDKSEYKDITDLMAEKKLASSGWTLAERQLHAKQKAKEKDAKKKKAKAKAKPKGRPMGKVERKPHGGSISFKHAAKRLKGVKRKAKVPGTVPSNFLGGFINNNFGNGPTLISKWKLHPSVVGILAVSPSPLTALGILMNETSSPKKA